ncbi:Large subunit GTPase 1 [Penicillium chermesinum]|nr:Large subunit GTPase 1 [Penicillium chermesinum]
MVLAKSKNSVGLGNSLMNDRFGKGKASKAKKASHNNAIARQGINGETYITNEAKEASWVKMRSITEQAALDEFLSTAELAGTDFTAEKINNVKIIHSDQKNPYLLSASEEKNAHKKHQKNRGRLTVPRRPKWDSTTTPQQLEMMELWRQLWRVIERSDLVVQIVDARNPLQFRSEDLENYVKEIDPKKKNLLLVNKADMLTLKQREAWADYFETHNINFRFFSAHLAKEKLEAELLRESTSDSEDEQLAEAAEKLDVSADEEHSADVKETSDVNEAEGDVDAIAKYADPEASIGPHILDVDELEELFLANSPETLPQEDGSERKQKQKTTIGLVGYPNVGKSSTINALLGAKKVSVSATPTLYLSPEIMLCDCPGLVFPNFATTKADLVVNGVLPIDQQREFTGPAGLVAQRIPKHFLENVYGVKINTRPIEEGGTGIPTASEPDESRAARYVLKDYVNGKLLFCHPPPTAEGEPAIDPHQFNEDLYDLAHLPARRQAALAKTIVDVDDLDSDIASFVSSSKDLQPEAPGQRSRNIDSGFFGTATGPSAGRMTLPFQSQYTSQGQQIRKNPTGRKERMMIAIERGIDVSDVRGGSSKKHFKGNKKQAKKKRNNGDADDDY